MDIRRTVRRAYPEEVDARLEQLEREWDLERLLDTHAGALILLGLGLGLAVDRRFLVLPAVVGSLLLRQAVLHHYRRAPLRQPGIWLRIDEQHRLRLDIHPET